MRPFTGSHPWISFAFDTTRLSWIDQFKLGEVYSKSRHLGNAPLMPSVSEELHRIFLVKGVLATTAIEGNTMTEEQVRQRVEGKHNLPQSREYQGVAVDKIAEICNEVLAGIAMGEPPELSYELVCDFNRRVLHGQDLEAGVVPGRLRTGSVVVGNYRGAPAEDCEYLVRHLVDWLNEDWAPPEAPDELRFGLQVLKAILAHVYLAWIHPFGDGNGRTARLLEYLLLATQGVPSPACHLLSNHYNLTRDRYYFELSRSSRAGKTGIYGFVSYALEGFVDGFRDQIDMVLTQQLQVTWVNYVHEQFGGSSLTQTQRRRRDLVLTMMPGQIVRRGDVPDLSTALARAYATKQEKTITRDLNDLVKRNLVRQVKGGYVPNIEVVYGFLPLAAIS